MKTNKHAPARSGRGLPLATWLLGVPGALCLLAGVGLFVTDLGHVHPMLADDGTPIVVLVSAVALLGTAAFPLAFRRLAEAEAGSRDQ